MNTRLLTIFSIVIVVLLSLFTRLFSLTKYPPSLFSDEVDAGYQAFVFDHSGTDYFGNRFPVSFHSFADWRTPADIYAIALTQKFISDPDLSVRLPSAVFGIISVFLFYLITRSVPAALLLAISPWAIHFSRTGFEVSGMLMSLLASIYFWQKFILGKKYSHLLLSLFFLALAPYFYSTAKFFIIIIGLLYLLIWFRKLSSFPVKKLILAAGFFTVLLTPLLIDTLNGRGGFRFSYISIFTQPHREQVTDALRYEDIYTQNIGRVGVPTPLVSFFLHNKYELVFEKFISNYLSSFSVDFLFLKGDGNLRQGFSVQGMLYIIDFLFIFLGILGHFRRPQKLGAFFFWLLVLAPLPFALTRDSLTAHSTRLILMLPSLLYFANLGLKRIPLAIPLYLISFLLFWHNYTIHYPQLSARSWHTNMKAAVLSASSLPAPVYFSDSFEPFLPFWLYYHRYLPSGSPPASHISHLSDNFFDGSVIDGQYYFGRLNWSDLPPTPATYVIPKTEYDSVKNPSLTVSSVIPKQYLNSEEFYIISVK